MEQAKKPGMCSCRLRSRQGATFIELLLALFVVVTSSLGIVAAYVSASLLSDDARLTRIAYEDLRDMIERIHATPFTNLAATFPAGTANGTANAYLRIVNGAAAAFELPNEQITVTYPAQTATRIEVLVTASWTHRNRVRTASLATIRTAN